MEEQIFSMVWYSKVTWYNFVGRQVGGCIIPSSVLWI